MIEHLVLASQRNPLLPIGAASYSPKCLERLSEKSLGGVLSVGFGGPTLQERALYAPFQQFVRFSVREFETFQTVSPRTPVNRGVPNSSANHRCHYHAAVR